MKTLDNADENEDFRCEDIQPEPLDADLAEQSLFISTNKTIAGIPSTNIEFGYIILLKIILAFVILYRKFRQ